MNVLHLKSRIDDAMLYGYLLEVDKDFGIPLSCKVDLASYASRLLSNGCVIAVKENEKLASIIGFYCNDHQQKTAHLPLLSTAKWARGKGYAGLLIREMIITCRNAGMHKICCDSVNPIAIHLYKSIGFKETTRTKEGDFEKIFLEYKII